MAEHYRGYYDVAEGVDPLTEKRYQAILGWLERVGRGRRVLDIGCGRGYFLVVAEGRGWWGVGLEVSESGLESARQLKKERGSRFLLTGGTIEQSAFSAESFDAITLFEVLEHLRDPMSVLQETHRLLHAGGLLYLTTPNFDGVSRRLLGRRWRVIADEHLVLFNSRTLRTCLEAAGFRLLTLRTKNIDVPGILAAWRNRGRRTERPVTTFSATRSLRRMIEHSPCLRGSRAVANVVLRLARLGDTIEVLARKGSS